MNKHTVYKFSNLDNDLIDVIINKTFQKRQCSLIEIILIKNGGFLLPVL